MKTLTNSGLMVRNKSRQSRDKPGPRIAGRGRGQRSRRSELTLRFKMYKKEPEGRQGEQRLLGTEATRMEETEMEKEYGFTESQRNWQTPSHKFIGAMT